MYPPACRFVGTLKQHTLQGASPGEEDLNVEHLQLLLLLFHNLSERGRRDALLLCSQALADVAAQGQSQLQTVPLNLGRLLLLFDYLLHQFSKAPVYLFEQVSSSASRATRARRFNRRNPELIDSVLIRYEAQLWCDSLQLL